MKKLIARIVVPLCVSIICTAANAEARVLEVWTCKLNEGQSLDNVRTENGKWVAYVNKSVSGGDIQSFLVTPVVGAQGGFMYVDSFPSMDAWIATKDAMTKGEGLAIDEALGEVATCASNSLYSSEEN